MKTLQRTSGVGMVQIISHWVTSYFRYEFLAPDGGALAGREDELWTVRVSLADHRLLALSADEPVQLRLPQHPEEHVFLRESWFEGPFVWLEFDRGPAADAD